jgi:hypothetical protein
MESPRLYVIAESDALTNFRAFHRLHLCIVETEMRESQTVQRGSSSAVTVMPASFASFTS